MSSSFIWIIVIVLALTVLGALALGSVTIFYYWGARGTPPPTTEQKRLLREQQERAKKNK
ncbi:MAG TPA: hypothetical protein PKE69_04950 [Pyrinomonadaceae bacterium]|nr:hypothetical protein [Pyrinomonadaceae bacterium]